MFFLPHSLQNFAPAGLTVPQEHTHSAEGFGEPHSEQNLPVLTVPQEQVQDAFASGFLAPHSAQNLPVLTLPQAQVQLFAAFAAAAALSFCAACICIA
jgi:hypothetical protein